MHSIQKEEDDMANLKFNEGRPAKEQIKGSSYIRMSGETQAQFKALMKALDFDPDSPRADAGVRKVGEMVVSMGIELANALLQTDTQNLAEYVEKIKAESTEPAEAETREDATTETK